MQANRRRMTKAGALGAILAVVVMGWEARNAGAQADALAAGEVAVDDTPADIAARAEASASDLATSLSWVATSMKTAGPTAKTSGQLTEAENDALVESAAKVQLTGMAEELDQLSAALASGQNSEATKALLQSLRRRGAVLSRLGQRSNQPLIPSELQGELMRLWSDVEKLSVSSSVVATPAGGAQVEVETLE